MRRLISTVSRPKGRFVRQPNESPSRPHFRGHNRPTTTGQYWTNAKSVLSFDGRAGECVTREFAYSQTDDCPENQSLIEGDVTTVRREVAVQTPHDLSEGPFCI